MARIRAQEWGAQEYWETRISKYLDCEQHEQKSLIPRVIYVALKEDAVIGFIAGHLTRRYGCDGELQWINVIPEQRGSGVAAELLRLLSAWFAEHAARRVCVDVEPANTAARGFYTRHGARELKKYWLVRDDIGIVLSKP